ncbi:MULTISPECIES: Crp/Fnr family transcriptional regulator [Flavobacteriaceae]|uniref:Crp/Fnr family transcriptional regulator n=1 Tax=Flavobacteriaceae TaxID=49546 RepID=UPI0015B10C7D|nr:MULTISPECIES: Crp/Fnr family transcriptional regulator [Flavobacteriaceae]
MINKSLLESYFSSLFEEELIDEMVQIGQIRSFEENEILIDLNQTISHMPLLLHGAIRIMRDDDNDGELLLYYLEKGDTCAMTMTCCLGTKTSNIRATAETDGEMLMIPVQKMDEWLAKYATWRAFVFNSYQDRLDEMMRSIDNLAFNDSKGRLKNYLIEVASVNKTRTVNKTHAEIAYEMNTSRVVISRLIKALENEGFIKQQRNSITIL